MSDLTNGVDTGIGARRRKSADRMIGNLSQRLLQTGLHGLVLRQLRLPATKPDAVVGCPVPRASSQIPRANNEIP